MRSAMKRISLGKDPAFDRFTKTSPKPPPRAARRVTMASPIMQFFTYAHLPERLQVVSKPIGDLARQIDETLPDCAEKSAGLRKLLEAKDCFVRAGLPHDPAR